MPFVDYNELGKRLGEDALRQRLLLEARHEADDVKQSLAWLQRFHQAIGMGFKVAGLYKRGRKNALDVRLEQNELLVSGLPSTFEGFRLLQLSDLHIDIDPHLGEKILAALKGVHYDLAVITGDFRCRTIEDYEPALNAMAPIVRVLKPPALAVLGNHDPLAMVPALEEMGLRFLLNEVYPLTREGQTLWIAGVDDPHFYRSHDLAAVAEKIPEGGCSILLAHSPEVAEEAEPFGFKAILAGHTHGGQICLPGKIPVIGNLKNKKNRQLIAGNWRWGALRGYTSRGTGLCGVPVRFNCPGEITLHTLKCLV